jgi:deoxyadenosine/deoxycytidine kinase
MFDVSYFYVILSITVIVLFLFVIKARRTYDIKVVVVEAKVGGGKSTFIRQLGGNVDKQFDVIIGTYYVNHIKGYMLVEEPLHLYQRNGMLKLCLLNPVEYDDVFQLSAGHIMHTHLTNVLDFAKHNGIKIVVMERHIYTVYKSFAEMVIDRVPHIEPNLSASYQLCVEDVLKKYGNVMHNKSLLHGCIYLDWASHETLCSNIRNRGREAELKILKNDAVYPVNMWLEKKHKHMLEIINVPIFYITEKIDIDIKSSKTIDEVYTFLENI